MRRRRFTSNTLLAIGFGVCVYADSPETLFGVVPAAIIGGQTSGSASYGALVLYPSGDLTSIPGLPETTSEISATAINGLGFGLVGGQGADGNGYAALVSPAGNPSTLSISFTGGTILGAAIDLSQGFLMKNF
jgi:hypothetical protein